jgi:hypothetical protein
LSNNCRDDFEHSTDYRLNRAGPDSSFSVGYRLDFDQATPPSAIRSGWVPGTMLSCFQPLLLKTQVSELRVPKALYFQRGLPKPIGPLLLQSLEGESFCRQQSDKQKRSQGEEMNDEKFIQYRLALYIRSTPPTAAY